MLLDQTIEIFRNEQFKAREHELIHRSRMCNLGLYLLLVDRDLSILKTQMVSSLDPWLLRFAGRQIALILYEACDDLTNLLGKDFRESLASMEFKDVDIRRFNAISKQVNDFKSDNRQFLYHESRNVIAAHRAQDSLRFLESIEAIDPLRVFRLGGDFWKLSSSSYHS